MLWGRTTLEERGHRTIFPDSAVIEARSAIYRTHLLRRFPDPTRGTPPNRRSLLVAATASLYPAPG